MIKKFAVFIVVVFLLVPFLAHAPVYPEESYKHDKTETVLWYINNPVATYKIANNVVSKKREYLRNRWEIFSSEADLRSSNKFAVQVAIAIEVLLAVLFVSWINPFSWFRIFFLKWFKVGKKVSDDSWGVVYNSLSKLPIDLATVRLVQASTKQVVQTKVTDKQGRFIFVVGPGEYRLEVYKPKFIFPSKLFLKIQQDGHKNNLYHGNIIKISDGNGVVAVNVPLDPSGEYVKPISYWVQSVSDNFRFIISWFSFLLALLFYIFFPQVIFLVLLELHGVLFIWLWLSSGYKQPKRWGTVYDMSNRKPIKGVTVKLFNAQFNKHIMSQTTDQRGRYYFVVGEGDYYLTFKHSGYVEDRLELPSLRGNSARDLMIDKALEKTLYRHPGGLSKIKERESKW